MLTGHTSVTAMWAHFMLFQLPFCICWDQFYKKWKPLSLSEGWWVKVRSRRRWHCWTRVPWRACLWDRAHEAGQAYGACWNEIWQAPQNGPLAWGQFAGWEGRHLRSSRQLPLALCTSCGCISCSMSDEVWLHSPLVMDWQKLIEEYMPCCVCSNISFPILTSEGSSTKKQPNKKIE